MALERWELVDIVVARIRDQTALNVQPANQIGNDVTWLVQSTPSAIVVAPEEFPSDPKKRQQPVCTGAKWMTAPIEIWYVFTGQEPRGDDRTKVGHPLLASVRDALWMYRPESDDGNPYTNEPFDWMGDKAGDYLEKVCLQLWFQYFEIDTFRRPVIGAGVGGGSFIGGDHFTGTGGMTG